MGAIAGHSLAHRCHSSGPLRGFPDNSDDAATAAASARAKAMAETKAAEELSKADDAKRRILIAQVEAAEAVAAAEKDKARAAKIEADATEEQVKEKLAVEKQKLAVEKAKLAVEKEKLAVEQEKHAAEKDNDRAANAAANSTVEQSTGTKIEPNANSGEVEKSTKADLTAVKADARVQQGKLFLMVAASIGALLVPTLRVCSDYVWIKSNFCCESHSIICRICTGLMLCMLLRDTICFPTRAARGRVLASRE